LAKADQGLPWKAPGRSRFCWSASARSWRHIRQWRPSVILS